MSAATQSLWPADIQPGILTPFVMLQQQAQALTEQTQGLLVGDAKRIFNEDSSVTYLTLDIVVPSLDHYRQRVLTATHKTKLIYPVEIDAELFRRRIFDTIKQTVDPWNHPKMEQINVAASDQEFRRLVQQVLESKEVKSAAVSLIAKANEMLEMTKHKPNGQPANPASPSAENEQGASS